MIEFAAKKEMRRIKKVNLVSRHERTGTFRLLKTCPTSRHGDIGFALRIFLRIKTKRWPPIDQPYQYGGNLFSLSSL